ncbi:hypothetical protein DH86_00003935, partial [Scytalidium sp. 3C]
SIILSYIHAKADTGEESNKFARIAFNDSRTTIQSTGALNLNTAEERHARGGSKETSKAFRVVMQYLGWLAFLVNTDVTDIHPRKRQVINFALNFKKVMLIIESCSVRRGRGYLQGNSHGKEKKFSEQLSNLFKLRMLPLARHYEIKYLFTNSRDLSFTLSRKLR